MYRLEEKLNILKQNVSKRKVKIMIMGLGSVGTYLLDYLMSAKDEKIEIFVVGRNREKMVSDVNIVRVAALIRNQNRTDIKIVSDVDFNHMESIARCIQNCQPDIIVNSSRAYSGLKYGSISWKKIRAYGIWAPLSIKYIRNIMDAYEKVGSNAIVIHTSYSDAVIPWLKTAGKAYPDFGSGNINHLIPRIQFAVAEEYGIADYWNIDVTYAVSHFHDVVISKEGQTEHVRQLIVYFILINIDVLRIMSHGILGLFSTAIFIPLYAMQTFLSDNTNSSMFHSVVLSFIFPKPPIEVFLNSDIPSISLTISINNSIPLQNTGISAPVSNIHFKGILFI